MSDPAAMTYDPQPRRPVWGVHIPLRKNRSTQPPLRIAPLPAKVWISLAQCPGDIAVPLVSPGQNVLCGEPVAETRRIVPGLRIHASISGRVSAIDTFVVAGSSNPVPCVVIESDGRDKRWDGYTAGMGALPDNGSAANAAARGEWRAAFQQRVAEGGILGLGGALFPTAQKLARAGTGSILLLNGAECESYISCDDMLIRERASLVVAGARLLMTALDAPRCVIAVKSAMPAARIALVDALAALGDERIVTSVVTSKYPSGGERQLVELIFGREVPAGGLPPDVGILCQNVATAAAVAQLFEHGQPLISRIVTVTGGAVTEPCNVEARIGTPVADLIALAGGYRQTPARLIMGGPMMGIALPADTLPITSATNCLIAATADELGTPRDEMPCIRCGKCVDACPARLSPQELLIAVRAGASGDLLTLGINECIECGACDYVCPSHIPLSVQFIAGKTLVSG
ncbi:MAG: electron transport complex subunit RsxC [Gammaproteobacteria bacterium]